ncbi:MAG: ABC transporter transmembrane domain-containing protein, partial [Oscillospiraceae bacterium]
MAQIKWVWQNLKGYRKRYIFALCSTVFLSATMMVNSIIISQIMDTIFVPIQNGGAVTSAVINSLVKLIVMLITWSVIRTAFEYVSVMTYEKCSQGLIYKLRGDLYKNMQRQDMSFFSENRTGDLMTRLTGDMDMIRHTVAWISRMTIDCVVLFVSTTVIFFVKDALFATCMLLVTPIIFVITMIFSKKVGPLYVDLREKLSQLNTCAQENISGNRVVKAFAREKYEADKFEEKNKDFKEANLKATLLWLKFAPYVDGISQSLSIAVLLVGGLFLINGRITIGTFTLFNSLCWTLANPMRSIGMLLNDIQRFFASATKIIELHNATPSIKNDKNSQTSVFNKDDKNSASRIKGEIKFENVSLKLHDTVVLSDINLNIKAGETVAIMGSTGCGKTSLINLIPRFSDVTKGILTLDGKEIKKWNLQDLRHSIGMATQDVFLFSDTVDSNIAYGDSDMPEEEVAKYAKIADVNF